MDCNENDETAKNNKLKRDCIYACSSFSYLLAAYHNPLLMRNSFNRQRVEMLGPKHLQIFKVTLPFDAAIIFKKIINAYDAHWDVLHSCNNLHHEAPLYSLTKHDVAVVDLPGNLLDLVQEIQTYIVTAIQNLYYIPFSQAIHMDPHQPHVLKYDASNDKSFRSVPLHHDFCHSKYQNHCVSRSCIMDAKISLSLLYPVTVNMTMNSSASNDYSGGGTYFLDLNETIVCEPNEFLIHPGYVVHAGAPITSGSRYLLISFINFVAQAANTSCYDIAWK